PEPTTIASNCVAAPSTSTQALVATPNRASISRATFWNHCFRKRGRRPLRVASRDEASYSPGDCGGAGSAALGEAEMRETGGTGAVSVEQQAPAVPASASEPGELLGGRATAGVLRDMPSAVFGPQEKPASAPSRVGRWRIVHPRRRGGETVMFSDLVWAHWC